MKKKQILIYLASVVIFTVTVVNSTMKLLPVLDYSEVIQERLQGCN